jgi:hypothetical protein
MKFNNNLSLNKRMVKIAFGYKRRVGKDTSCDYLIGKYGGIKLSFAEPLYQILYFAQDICGFEHSKDRKFLQFVGTEWARTINSDVWAELLVKKVVELEHVNSLPGNLPGKGKPLWSDEPYPEGVWSPTARERVKNMFVSDLRFENEFKILKKLGFICVKIENKNLDDVDGYLNHQSDKDLDNFNGWDYTIDNFGDLNNLYDQLDHLYRLN